MRLPDKVRLPATEITEELSVMARLTADNAEPKETPADLVIVTVPRLEPTAPVMLAAPEVLMVRLGVPEAPLMVEFAAMRLAAPAPNVRVVAAAKVVAATVIAPVEVPPMSVLAVVEIAFPSKLSTPVPDAEMVPANDLELGAVAVTPAVNCVEVPATVRVPVLLKVVAPAMVLVVPVRLTL